MTGDAVLGRPRLGGASLAAASLLLLWPWRAGFGYLRLLPPDVNPG